MRILNEQVIEAALALPPEQREKLINLLLESLAPNQPDCRSAWIAEIRRRLDDYRSGRVQTIPSNEAFERVRRCMTRK